MRFIGNIYKPDYFSRLEIVDREFLETNKYFRSLEKLIKILD